MVDYGIFSGPLLGYRITLDLVKKSQGCYEKYKVRREMLFLDYCEIKYHFWEVVFVELSK